MTRDMVPEDRYERVLGLPQVTISGVAVIIGAGIFVLLGPATQKAGGLVWRVAVVAITRCAKDVPMPGKRLVGRGRRS
ncbi:MAG: hypothetical protein ACO3IV_01840, partial [Ilumatobacteraceae bacterium]